MRILIIEDEIPNARRLERMLQSIGPFETFGPIQTVSSAIQWLEQNPAPDIILMDIQLIDGDSFQIWEHRKIESFVIFTTAFDQFALKAFEVNAIDYLLKPIELEKLTLSIEKAKKYAAPSLDTALIQMLSKIKIQDPIYRKRILVNFRDRIIPIKMDEIAYFFSEFKITHLVTNQNQIYPLDITLEKLEEELDPDLFMRVTRQIIVKAVSITNIYNLFNGQIGIEVRPSFKEKIHLSREKSSTLKRWLEQ